MVSNVLVGVVAFLHVYFLVLEMFLWATPFGAKTFKRPLDEMIAQKALAGNQGLYNGFLAAGLVWSLVAAEPFAFDLKLFFLGCVIVAGALRRRDSFRGRSCSCRRFPASPRWRSRLLPGS